MRIRKRQPVVLESPTPPQPTFPRLAVNIPLINPEVERFIGQNCCTCCSREKQLYWELNKEVESEDDAPDSRFAVDHERSVSTDDKGSLSKARTAGYIRGQTVFSITDKHAASSSRKIIAKDLPNSQINIVDKEVEASASLGSMGDFSSARSEDNTKLAGGRAVAYDNGLLLPFEGDINHPGNKPKESLLYSLYCVFSKLSGKAVLTAREALSKIIEQRLPGLDERTGLPSVQVAKVMRSNPYFVHIEGGKFFLCSGPAADIRDEVLRGAKNSENPPRSISPVLEQKGAPLNSLTKADNEKEISGTDVRTKRARSKDALTDDDYPEKVVCVPRVSRKVGVKSPIPQTTVTQHNKDAYGDDVNVPICKRYDGRGWKCNEKALEGYSMCRHHHELIVNRLARLRNSGRLGPKKPVKRRKGSGKLKEGTGVSGGEHPVSNEQNGAQWWKTVKARSLKSINN